MKKVLIVLITLIFGCMVGGTCIFWKYGAHLGYAWVIKNGQKNKYLQMEKGNWELLAGESLNGSDLSAKDAGSAWKNLHFSDYLIPIPLHHPIYVIVPYIGKTMKKGVPQMGFKFLAPAKDSTFVFFHTMSDVGFVLRADDQPFFSLPLIWDVISQKTSEEIWKDLFRKNLALTSSPDIISSSEYYKHLARMEGRVSWRELAYNLYLLCLRQKYFGDSTLKLLWSSSGMGVFEKKATNSAYRDEVYHFRLEDNRIKRLYLRTKRGANPSDVYRKKLNSKMKLKLSYPGASNILYIESKSLDYEKRIGQEGMAYRFAAWTHVVENKNFLEEIILFLEKGKNNMIQLAPLYEYALKKYGTNFSKLDNTRKESGKVFLERKIGDEQKKQIQDAITENAMDGEKFPNNQDKVDYLLRKAKESKKNSDKRDDILTVD
ncbi:MAG: hypothetical protein KAQ98_04590 [Bacteriovoracaceae bacterium]|nr:hypothetical protein [Bacteriovoracaceae bacterium]